MRFLRNDCGEMELQGGENILREMSSIAPISSAYIFDVPEMKKSFKHKAKNYMKNVNFAGVAIGSGGVFWSAFLTYIFPWMLDIAKVYCAIRIAQAFYQEKRGGRDDGSGFGALLTWGKWYLIFWLLPWGVELIDQIGNTMFNDLQTKPIITVPTK